MLQSANLPRCLLRHLLSHKHRVFICHHPLLVPAGPSYCGLGLSFQPPVGALHVFYSTIELSQVVPPRIISNYSVPTFDAAIQLPRPRIHRRGLTAIKEFDNPQVASCSWPLPTAPPHSFVTCLAGNSTIIRVPHQHPRFFKFVHGIANIVIARQAGKQEGFDHAVQCERRERVPEGRGC